MDVISRKDAKEKGLKRFFTGEPCKYGHLSERYVSSNECLECTLPKARKKSSINYKKNPDKVKSESKRWQSKNMDLVKSRHKNYSRKSKYPIPTRPYPKDGLCENSGCRLPETRIVNGKTASLCLDHCHTTGEFRGWLCHKCNTMIGLASDSVSVLIGGAEYLSGFEPEILACY